MRVLVTVVTGGLAPSLRCCLGMAWGAGGGEGVWGDKTHKQVTEGSAERRSKSLGERQRPVRELPDVQAGLDKAVGPEIKLPTSAGSSQKQESSRKTSISASLTMPKPLIVWITINFGEF